MIYKRLGEVYKLINIIISQLVITYFSKKDKNRVMLVCII